MCLGKQMGARRRLTLGLNCHNLTYTTGVSTTTLGLASLLSQVIVRTDLRPALREDFFDPSLVFRVYTFEPPSTVSSDVNLDDFMSTPIDQK